MTRKVINRMCFAILFSRFICTYSITRTNKMSLSTCLKDSWVNITKLFFRTNNDSFHPVSLVRQFIKLKIWLIFFCNQKKERINYSYHLFAFYMSNWSAVSQWSILISIYWFSKTNIEIENQEDVENWQGI